MSIRFLKATASVCAAITLRAEVIINEIHFDPDVKTEHVEFIELRNTAATPASLSGWKLTDAVDYPFPPDATIPANGYLVVAQNPAQFTAKFRTNAFGPWAGSLSNDGEEIVLRDATGRIVDSVDYKLGFPWPTVGEPPGFSIELANPAFDNNLGGNWRASGAVTTADDIVLIPGEDTWSYFKGTQEPSDPIGAWREKDFPQNAAWQTARMPMGYGGDIAMRTQLDDMLNNYTTVYFRKVFNVSDLSQISALQLRAKYDDGFKVWINGRLLIYPSMSSDEVRYSDTASSGAEVTEYFTFTLPPPQDYLLAGDNIIAVQAANISLTESSDFFIDLELIGKPSAHGTAPTPSARNNAFASNIAPAIREVDHSPKQPVSDQPVKITAKITDPEGVASVQLQYQIVEPGSFIELTNPAYKTGWTSLPMGDTGADGDEFAGDSVFTGTIPASIQVHRRLIRYRITATDATGKSIQAPYPDDPTPNFAYFCYNGVPGWSGAIQPGSADPNRSAVQFYDAGVMSSLPVYHLISKKDSVEASTWFEQYGGDEYKWSGALVYNGEVYDHIHYRARGGVWRYAMGKNMWKLDFNRGHDFRPRDNWGRNYSVGWTKLNLGACIQQGNYQHRGEQGLFESVGFRLFNLAGTEAPKTHFIHFRIIDEGQETGADQYTGDFWGLYLAIEQEDSRFLEEHDLPDSNFYKMEGGTGELNNLSPYGPANKSDLNNFLNAINQTQNEPWWRANFDLQKYYAYRTIVEGIHHYDIDGNPGKNYFYYTNDVSKKWEVHAWDLDLTWADNMYGSGNEQFKSRVLPISNFNREYKNRIREIRDLLFNTDQAYKLIDEYAAMIYTQGAPSFVGADRAQWDYNPIMAAGFVNSSKAGQGRFYQIATTKNFPGMVQLMKNYIVARSSTLDTLASETGLPVKPGIVNRSPANNPANRLRFESTGYLGDANFKALKWRLGEITPAGSPAFDPTTPRVYEIEPVWESTNITTFNNVIEIPSGVVKVGHTYRARIKMQDAFNRWSNWSAPVEFVAGAPDNAVALAESLQITEIMYNPPAGNEFEFVELYNSSADATLDLSGLRFTAGIDFLFPANSQLPPRSYALVIRASNVSAFRAHYGLGQDVRLFGPYSGALNNDGEEITLKTGAAGATILSFTYGNGALWPVAADGAGHSLVPIYPVDQSYPGNWRASAFIKGSPGAEDPEPVADLALNQIVANSSDNDLIQVANATARSIDTSAYYLSDDPALLKKWKFNRDTFQPNSIFTFEEVIDFHNPLSTGFGLDQAGEQVYLSYLPGDASDRVVDAVKFKGQSRYVPWARIPEFTGFWHSPLSDRLIISEVMYHPATNANSTLDNTLDEYVEIYNPLPAEQTLASPAGTWRIDGGIKLQFPANTKIPANGYLILVSFDPTLASASNSFAAKFQIGGNARIVGPWQGKLSNKSDRIALERPEPPKAVGEPLSWIIVDEVTYGLRPLWPVAPDGGGMALHRAGGVATVGNNPAAWVSAVPGPSRSVSPIDIRIASAEINNNRFTVRLSVESGRRYALERSADLSLRDWQIVHQLEPAAGGIVELRDPDSPSGQNFYRVQIAAP